jgi:hypothetical protein
LILVWCLPEPTSVKPVQCAACNSWFSPNPIL